MRLGAAKGLYLVFIIIILFVVDETALNAAFLEIAGSLRIRIPPEEGVFYERFLISPLMLLEGYKQEIILWRGAFLQVYSKEGAQIKRVGRKGEGPGEFSIVSDMNEANGMYYFLDLPNRLSIFNGNFDFEKRILLAGNKSSPVIFDLTVGDDVIVSAQRWRTIEGNLARDETITIYGLQGKWLHAFFNIKKARKSYPSDSILGGRVIIINKHIYYAFQPINRIWMFNLEGELIQEKSFGDSWWRKITYDRKKELKIRKKGNISLRQYYEDVYSTGDRIYSLSEYKNHLLVHIIRDHDGVAETPIFVLDLKLERELGPLFLEGYHLAGVGAEYLYFSKYVGEFSPGQENEVELVKCRIVF